MTAKRRGGVPPNHARRAEIARLRAEGKTLRQIAVLLDPPVTQEAVRQQLLLIKKQGLTAAK